VGAYVKGTGACWEGMRASWRSGFWLGRHLRSRQGAARTVTVPSLDNGTRHFRRGGKETTGIGFWGKEIHRREWSGGSIRLPRRGRTVPGPKGRKVPAEYCIGGLAGSQQFLVKSVGPGKRRAHRYLTRIRAKGQSCKKDRMVRFQGQS